MAEEVGPFPAGWYRPSADASLYWQLQGKLRKNIRAEIYDIDLFDTSPETIGMLKKREHRVVCYFSAGSWEKWRPDAGKFPASAKGKTLEGWEEERWLDIRNPAVRKIMLSRMDLAVEKGCDGIEPDNVDGFSNRTGFGLSASDQLDYNRFLAEEAHRRGLGIVLKNDMVQAEELQPWFDFALVEQCYEYRECDMAASFLKAHKAVFDVEYAGKYVRNVHGIRKRLCADAQKRGIRVLILPTELDGSFRIGCEGR